MASTSALAIPAASASAEAPRGVIILAGSHGAIALARGFARQGLKTWFLTNFTPLPRFSRAMTRSRRWPGADDPRALEYLEDLVRKEGLAGYLLIPAADPDVKFAAQHRERLERHLRVLLPAWSSLRWAAEKRLCYQRGSELGIAVPRIHPVRHMADALTMKMQFPVVLKPSHRIAQNAFTRDKVWQANDRAEFARLYARAAELVGADAVVVQELVPGGGDSQLSYAGLWWQGRPVASFCARRTRQYPLEFSYTSTYVETVEAEDVRRAAETFLRSIGHHGLCEIEFKRDPRSGELKLLDVNPRPWSWYGLAEAAGMDFARAILALCAGEAVPPMQARCGVGWMFAVRDVVVAMKLAGRRQIDWRGYLSSLGRTRAMATFSLRDPLPGLLENPLIATRLVARRFGPRAGGLAPPEALTE